MFWFAMGKSNGIKNCNNLSSTGVPHFVPYHELQIKHAGSNKETKILGN